MEKLIEDAMIVLNDDPQASVASGIEAHLARIDPDDLAEPLLTTARFRAYLADRGLRAAARAIADVVRRQRVRLPSVRTAMLERSGDAWQRFSSSGDAGVPMAATAALSGPRNARRNAANLHSFGIVGDAVMMQRRQ
ncbi:MAG: hypothetical protein AAFN74_16315 [Myxococcota bacterium]